MNSVYLQEKRRSMDYLPKAAFFTSYQCENFAKEKYNKNNMDYRIQRTQSVGKIVKNSRVQITPTQKPTQKSLKNSRVALGNITSSNVNNRQSTPIKNYQDQEKQNNRLQLQNKYNQMIYKYEMKKKQLQKDISSMGRKTLTDRSNKQNEVKQNKFRGEKRKNILITSEFSVEGELKAKLSQRKNNQFNQFFTYIEKQIQFEKQLRLWKNKINRKNQHKIKQTLIGKFKIPQQVLKLEFEQFDPYANQENHQPSDRIIQNIVLCHSKCQEHWNRYLFKKFKKSEIKQMFEKIDAEKSGFITLKAMVRQLNTALNKNYRKRDLFRVYKRLGEENVTFTTFHKVFSQ